MAYIKQTWVDQEGQVRYTETTDGDYKIFTPNYEEVTEIGTPVNATNMNHIEQGIYDCYTDLVKRKSTSSATGSTTQPVYIKADGTVETCEQIPDISNLYSDISPDYSSLIEITHPISSAPYTAPKAGIYLFYSNSDASNRSLYINGTPISALHYQDKDQDAMQLSITVPLDAGDVIYWSGSRWTSRNAFVPYKGA